MQESLFHTEWQESDRVLLVRLAGRLTLEQVHEWESGLLQMSRHIPVSQPIKVLIDLRGYEVSEQAIEVHKVQRLIMPALLAKHAFTVGYFKMFDAENTIPADPALARCIAVAHVHHDENKMARYNENIGSVMEKFFTDTNAAHQWLCAAA